MSHTIYSRGLLFCMVICAGLGGILYGYDVGVYSGVLPYLRSTFHLSTNQIGIIGGAMFGGGLLGTLISGYLADRWGRRTLIVIASLFFLLGIGLILLASSFLFILVARTILGIGVGIIAVSVPAYLNEVAPKRWRGRSVSMFQLFLTLGILLAYIVGRYFEVSGNWKGNFVVILFPTFMLLITMLLLPESPRFLILKNKINKAKKILRQAHSTEEAELEIQEILMSTRLDSGWKTLFSKALFFPLFIAVFVGIFNQLTAINAFLQYAPDIFQESGFLSHASAMNSTIILGLINFIGTIAALTLVDQWGRRRLLKLGTGGIVIAYAFLALATPMQCPPLVSLIGLVGFVFSFAIGPGVVVWLAISELFPTEVRGKGIAVALFANSLTAWLITSTFLQLKEKLGLSGMYWLFSGLTLIYFLVTSRWLHETKQKSLEEVQSELKF